MAKRKTPAAVPVTPPVSPEQPRLLTIKAAALYLSASVWAVRTLAWEQRVPYIRLGRRMLFDRADLDRYIEAQKQGARP